MSWKSSTYRWDTLYIETIKMQMGTNSQDVETFKNKLCEHLMIFYFDIWNTKSLFFCCHDGCDMGCQVFTKGIQIFWPKIIIIKGILTHFYGFRRNVLACSGVQANEVFLLYLFKALFIAWTYPLAPSSYHVVQNKNIKHSTEG